MHDGGRHELAGDVSVVFSALYSEDPAYLAPYVTNFLSFTDPQAALIINGKDLEADALAGLDTQGRVIVHNGKVKRNKQGSTLLLGHLENLDIARRAAPGAEYFCTTASNALFMRRFRSDSIPGLLERFRHHDVTFPLDALPDWWHWGSVRADQPFLSYLKSLGLERVTGGQIEGFLCPISDWNIVAASRPFFEAQAISGPNSYYYEEIVPTTFSNLLGSNKHCVISANLWYRLEHGGLAAFRDLFFLTDDAEKHGSSFWSPEPYIMKWFRRDPEDPLTWLLTRQESCRDMEALRTFVHAAPLSPAAEIRSALLELLAADKPVDALTRSLL